MDEFGVLTERYGLKAQGKSAPMAAPRVDPLPAMASSSSSSSSYFNSASSSFDVFGGTGGVSHANSSFDHFDTVFSSSKSSSVIAEDNSSYDIFGSLPSHSNRTSFANSSSGDLLGDFEPPKLAPPENVNDSFNGLDDFAFAPISSSYSTNSYASEDPFVVLESATSGSSAKYEDPLPGFTVKTSKSSSKLRPPPMPGKTIKADKGSFIDDFQEFTISSKEARRSPKATKYKEAEEASQNFTHDSSFDILSGSRSTSAPKSRVTTQDLFFDLNSSTDTSSNHFNPSNASSTKNGVDDLYSILGDSSFSATTLDGGNKGSDERSEARNGRRKIAEDKIAKALADMKSRDSKAQQEQEERRQIAEQMDVVIKRWAAGKQGNLRALLSSLHQVLWPESGWEAVSQSDIVSSSEVKRCFRKASLCVHPDKVQQKGSSLHERYISEKVFDILKEAWNKFNRDER